MKTQRFRSGALAIAVIVLLAGCHHRKGLVQPPKLSDAVPYAANIRPYSSSVCYVDLKEFVLRHSPQDTIQWCSPAGAGNFVVQNFTQNGQSATPFGPSFTVSVQDNTCAPATAVSPAPSASGQYSYEIWYQGQKCTDPNIIIR